MQMYGQIALGAVWLVGLGAVALLMSQMVGEFRAESRAARERRCRKEVALKCKVRPACRIPPSSVWTDGNGSLHVAF